MMSDEIRPASTLRRAASCSFLLELNYSFTPASVGWCQSSCARAA